MYTGPSRLTRAWQKVREFPPAVQGAAVVAVVVLAAVGAARSHEGSSDPNQVITPSTSAAASSLDTTPSAEPSLTPEPSLSPTGTPSTEVSAEPMDEPTDEPTDEPSDQPTSTVSPTPTSTSFMYSSCKAIKAAGRDPVSRGEYGYNPELDKDYDGVDCH